MILKETKYSEIEVSNNIYKNLYYLHELEIKYNLLNNPQFKKYWYTDPEQGEEKYYHAQERKQVINPKLKKQINDISKWLLSYYYIVLSSWYQAHNFYDKEYPLICQVQRATIEYKPNDVEIEDDSFYYTEQLTIDQQKGRLRDILLKFDQHYSQNDIVLFTLLHLMVIGDNDTQNGQQQRRNQYNNQILNQIKYLLNLYLKITDLDYDILYQLQDIALEFNEGLDENTLIRIFNDPNVKIQGINDPDVIINIHNELQKISQISKITNKNKLITMIENIIIQNIYNENPLYFVLEDDNLTTITEAQILIKDKLLPGNQTKKDKMFYGFIEKYLAPVRKARLKNLTGGGNKFLKTNLEKAKEAIDLCYKTLISMDTMSQSEKIYKLIVIMNKIEGLVHSNGDILDYMSPSDLYITEIQFDYPHAGVEQYLYPDIFNIMVEQLNNEDFYEYFRDISDLQKFFNYNDFNDQEFNNKVNNFTSFGTYLSFLSRMDKKQPKMFNQWIDDLVSYGISPEITHYMKVKEN